MATGKTCSARYVVHGSLGIRITRIGCKLYTLTPFITRWDWYLRSRSVDELKRRCEVLIRHIQKEFEAKKQQKTAASNSSKSKEKTDTNDASEAASKKTTKDSTSKSKSKSKAPAAAKATAATATKKRKREEQADTSSTRRASKRVKK